MGALLSGAVGLWLVQTVIVCGVEPVMWQEIDLWVATSHRAALYFKAKFHSVSRSICKYVVIIDPSPDEPSVPALNDFVHVRGGNSSIKSVQLRLRPQYSPPRSILVAKIKGFYIFSRNITAIEIVEQPNSGSTSTIFKNCGNSILINGAKRVAVIDEVNFFDEYKCSFEFRKGRFSDIGGSFSPASGGPSRNPESYGRESQNASKSDQPRRKVCDGITSCLFPKAVILIFLCGALIGCLIVGWTVIEGQHNKEPKRKRD